MFSLKPHEYRMLLADVLSQSPEWVFLNLPNIVLTKIQQQQLNEYIHRRKLGEPIAKIIGFKEFYGRSFKTNQHTLDPRPDSETLIDAVKNYYQSDVSFSVLDLGLGTGCLLLSILLEFPNAFGIGVDKSFEALKVARANQQHFDLMARSFFIQGHWGNALRGTFDVIISNPPYIGEHELLDTSTLYDPKIALFAENNGLQAYQEIFATVKQLLKADGYVFVEIGKDQFEDVNNIAKNAGWILNKSFLDLAGIKRVLCYVLI